MMNTSSIEALDRVLDDQEHRVCLLAGRVVCRACGSDIVPVTAVGIAAEKITAHLNRWCAVLPEGGIGC
ncbi:hypothetical protein [Mobilicoccus caccae]|nr:hypothetical protein [Mobilicoccus caccae]